MHCACAPGPATIAPVRHRITVITVTYNSGGIIKSCLEALPRELRVVVMDNGSTDETAQLAEQQQAHVVRNQNIGYGKAASLALNSTTTDYALLINPDARVSEQSLSALLACADRHPEIGILGARTFHVAQGTKVYDYRHAFDQDGLAHTNWIHGAFMFFRMEALKKVGTFDENIFLFYEEGDLCNRFLAHGYKLAVLDAAEVEHVSGFSSQESPRTSRVRAWHSAWSRAYFYKKHFGLRKALRKSLSKAFKYTINLIRHGLQLNRKAATYNLFEILGLMSFFLGISAFDKRGRARVT